MRLVRAKPWHIVRIFNHKYTVDIIEKRCKSEHKQSRVLSKRLFRDEFINGRVGIKDIIIDESSEFSNIVGSRIGILVRAPTSVDGLL